MADNSRVDFIIDRLKMEIFPSCDDDEHWGIAITVKEKYSILKPYINRKWLEKVKKAQNRNRDEIIADPQVIMQYISGKFFIRLECYVETIKEQEPKHEITEIGLRSLLEIFLKRKYQIYDQNNDKIIFPN